MERVVEDVGQKTVAACVRTPGPGGGRQEIVQTFGTMTAELLALRDWLQAHGVTHVAMESTGVYWKMEDGLLRAGGCLRARRRSHASAPGGSACRGADLRARGDAGFLDTGSGPRCSVRPCIAACRSSPWSPF